MSMAAIESISDNRKEINSSSNIIKVLLDLKEKGIDIMDLCSPSFPDERGNDDSSSEGEIDLLLSKEVIEHVRHYAKDIRNKIFNEFAMISEEKNISYMNMAELHFSLFENPIYQNFD
jgi:hypothetical protein